MPSELATIVSVAPGRLLGLAADGEVRLVWDHAAIRLPVYDLAHLAAVLDAWCAEEEPPLLRRGYYRLAHGPEGGVQLWIHTTGILLSREDVRLLATMIAAAARELGRPLCRQPRAPLGPGYRPLSPPRRGADSQN